MGLFVKSIDCEDVLKSCKEFILTCTADELLDVSKAWSEEDNLISKTWSEADNLISKTWSEDDNLISKTWSQDDNLISKTWNDDDNLISKTWSEDDNLISKTWSEDDNLISNTWSEDDNLISKTWSEDDNLISKTWSEDDNLISKTWSEDDNLISKTWSEDDDLISKTWSEDDNRISKTWSEDDDLISKTWSEDDNLISKTWSEDDNLIKFMLDKEMLSVTLPTVTHWISTESRVVMVLDGIEECGLQEEMAKMSNVTLELMAKMFEICEEGLNMKRVYKLQTYIMSQSQPPPRPVVQLEIDSGSLLEYLKPKRWREFNLDQITSLHHPYKIEDFFFAEISLDWISSTKPAQPAVGQLWDIIVQSKISDEYLVDLRTSIQFYDANLNLPTVNEDIKADKYTAACFTLSGVIKQKLTGSGLTNDILMSSDCRFKDCIIESEHGTTFKLTDTIPCYQLGVEGGANVHHHHDKVFHWYGTEEKKGERVMISFVTNTMAEVIERVGASDNIYLHFLKCNLS